MVMAVFMNQIVDQIEAVPVEAVDEGKPWPVPVTETHDALGPERDDPSGQKREDLLSFRPGLLYDCPGLIDPLHLLG